MSKARNLSDFISDATIDSTEIADLSVTHAKLHTDMNLSSKTLTFAANQISGNSVDGGVISNFASTGIDDNASATAVTILSDGKVGIGTSSPSAKLYINQLSASTGLEVYVNDVGTSKIADLKGYDNVLGVVSRMVVQANGNVGIGDTTPTEGKLVVRGDANTNGLFVGGNSTTGQSYGALINAGTNSSDANFRLYDQTGSTSYMFVRGDGNVGIGTTSPSAPLTIGSGATRRGSYSDLLIAPGGDNGQIEMWGANTSFAISHFDNDRLGIYSNVSGGWGETRGINIKASNGNVGIGTTSPTAKLHVEGTALLTSSTSMVLTLNPTSNGYGGIAFQYAGVTKGTSLYNSNMMVYGGESGVNTSLQAGGQYGLFIAHDTRNVGIGTGTTTPADKLDVQGADNGITIRSVTANRPVLSLINGSSTMLKISANNTYGAIGDGSDANRYMSFRGANVGIGDTTPSEKLDVNGRLRVAPANAYANLNQIGYQAAIYAGETSTGTGEARYIPLIAHTSTSSSGYRQHTVFGSRRGGVWGSAFIGVGGNDAYPTNSFEFNYTGTFTAPSTKNFQIDHPIPEKTNTHYLVHAAIEGPQADLIYRGKIDLVNGSAVVDLDQAARMTSGTFILLCTNVQCFTSNESNWDLVKGSVSGATLTIESQNANSTAEISWMVVAERKDNGVQHFPEGRLEVEPLKENEPE